MFGIKEREKIPCKTCGKSTPMLGTKLCDPCWEVETRLPGYLNNKNAIQFVLKALDKAQPEPQHGTLICELPALKPKPLAEYLAKYIEHELEDNTDDSYRELLEQALEAYESTENVMIQIIKKKER